MYLQEKSAIGFFNRKIFNPDASKEAEEVKSKIKKNTHPPLVFNLMLLCL